MHTALQQRTIRNALRFDDVSGEDVKPLLISIDSVLLECLSRRLEVAPEHIGALVAGWRE